MKRLTNMTTKFTNFNLLKSPDLPNPGLKDWNRYLTNYNTWSNKFDKLKDKVNPTIEELETFFGQTPYEFDTVFHALKLKYKALIYNPSTIEKTMTPVQLYLSENPLWTVGLSATDVDHVLNNTVGGVFLFGSLFIFKRHFPSLEALLRAYNHTIDVTVRTNATEDG